MIATTRAMLKPCSPPGSPQPSMRSLMSAGSSWGTLARAAVIICRTASSGRMVVRDPLNALPMGDLAVATITASGMAAPSDSLGLLVSSLCQRPAPANCSPPLHDHEDLAVPGIPQGGRAGPARGHAWAVGIGGAHGTGRMAAEPRDRAGEQPAVG